MKKKNTGMLALMLYGATAVIWIALVISRFAAGSSYLLELLCAILWAAGFFLLLRRYREGKKK